MAAIKAIPNRAVNDEWSTFLFVCFEIFHYSNDWNAAKSVISTCQH